jgi:AcrR family transcriptional regulator
MGHVERKLREKENLRNGIIEAAIDIAREEGWPSLTIRKIADRIEYTPPIVYEHFENKEALINEIVLIGFRKLRDQYEETSSKEYDPKKLLRLISRNFWNFAFENREIYMLMFSLERPTPNEEVKAIIERIHEMFVKLAEGDSNLAHNLMFNWMCLQNGTIATVMNIGETKFRAKGAEPVDIFMSFIDRFLKSI